MLEALTYSLFAATCLVTGLHLVSRWLSIDGNRFWLDDVTAFFTLLASTGTVVSVSNLANTYQGRDDDQDVKFFFWLFVYRFFFVAIVFGTKISLALHYVRAPLDNTVRRRICWLVVITMAISLVAFDILAVTRCSPVRTNWEVSEHVFTTCVRQTTYDYVLGGTDITSNLTLAAMSISCQRHRDMSISHKVRACSKIVIGLAVIACSAVRLKYIHLFSLDGTVSSQYDGFIVLSSCEIFLGQIYTSLPPTASLLWRGWYHMLSAFTTADDSSFSIMTSLDRRHSIDVEENSLVSSHGSDSAIAPVIQRQGHQLRPKDSFPGLRQAQVDPGSSAPIQNFYPAPGVVRVEVDHEFATRTISADAFCRNRSGVRSKPFFRKHDLRSDDSVTMAESGRSDKQRGRLNSLSSASAAARVSTEPAEEYRSWPRGGPLSGHDVLHDDITARPTVGEDEGSERSLTQTAAQQALESTEYF